MSRWLVDSDLDLHIALNLDGGPSTGLLLADSNLSIPAFSPLPAVITVHEK
ncbi:MAG: phosphodiester glycosidase family protein [Chloroflexi bacterium]|nr:phosphodiester glycosidase family protein [Chloroflexota bacterium]